MVKCLHLVKEIRVIWIGLLVMYVWNRKIKKASSRKVHNQKLRIISFTKCKLLTIFFAPMPPIPKTIDTLLEILVPIDKLRDTREKILRCSPLEAILLYQWDRYI